MKVNTVLSPSDPRCHTQNHLWFLNASKNSSRLSLSDTFCMLIPLTVINMSEINHWCLILQSLPDPQEEWNMKRYILPLFQIIWAHRYPIAVTLMCLIKLCDYVHKVWYMLRVILATLSHYTLSMWKQVWIHQIWTFKCNEMQNAYTWSCVSSLPVCININGHHKG